MRNEHHDSSEKQEALDSELHAGVKFFGVRTSTAVTTGYLDVIAEDARNSYSIDTETTHRITCTEKYLEPGVGLWQWVIESSDGQISVMTQHTVCRYGELYNTPPACPWNACLGTSA